MNYSNRETSRDKVFVVAAYLAREKVALGEGRAKQETEQDAAQRASSFRGGWGRVTELPALLPT